MKTATPDRASLKSLNIRLATMLCCTLAIQPAAAQLAITEAMSSASLAGGPDFWELTNFGEYPIDLTGYSFNDMDGVPYSAVFKNLTILSRQSVIFVEQKAATFTPNSFRQWWGLNAYVPVMLYTNHGLAPSGDGIRLWSSTNTTDEFLVDSISFSQAAQGHTFCYNPTTDAFDELSGIGTNGAFKAASSTDVGSPGTPPEPVPLEITAQLTNTMANTGDTVTLTVGKRGLPPPTFQWFHNFAPIPGARSASLTITNLQSDHEGSYRVVLSNYFDVVRSTIATLTVSLVPAPPRWLQVPADLIVFAGQSPTLLSLATGVPQPSYQWYFNGEAILGARQNSFTVYNAEFMDTGAYTVVARNTNGAVTNVVQLTVTPRPDLRITEVMPSQTTNATLGVKRNDWWELTSFETSASIDLFGYRFNEDNGDHEPHRDSAWTNMNHVIIHPGESVIFVEKLTSAEFREWWGVVNLPVDLQVITYQGGGLGLDSIDDAIWLWNPGATTDTGWLYATEWFEPNAPLGVSFTCEMAITGVGYCDQWSVQSFNGTVVAQKGGDIGSPGYSYIHPPTEPPVLSITRVPAGWGLAWRSVVAGNYVVQRCENLSAGNWHDLETLPPAGPTTSFLDTNANGSSQLFYRVIRRTVP